MCDSSEKRLCTDSEWKYAGRGGNAKCEYGTKNCLLPNDTNACYQKDTPCDVGSYPPNALGLYDMSGNVSEWVGKFSVYNLWTIRPELCGGSWESNLDKEKLKVDSCLDIAPEVMDPKYGFRCCKDLQE
jgi:formylglycine-generating enzyme required for sulfatase activity